MLYAFDLDGTLISGYMDNPNKEYDLWSVLPGRIPRLAALRHADHQVAIITNQGAVAFGLVTEQQARDKITAAITALGLAAETPVAVCFADTRGRAPYNDPTEAARRKPSGAMIREVMAAFPLAAAAGVLFVGDRPEDEAAARDAGVPFQWAHEFFS